MRPVLPITLSLALLAGSGAIANDQIYKCVDPNGTMLLSDKPCAVVESVAADAGAPAAPDAVPGGAPQASLAVTALPADVNAAPATPTVHRTVVAKEHFTLPPAEVDPGQGLRKPLATTPPKVDVATLKAARLKLELEDRNGSRQASVD
jgi:hypothetical protein